jgi:putative YhdH/YhfP family quinone oxidoreductase
MIPTTLRCYLVSRDASGAVSAGMTERPTDELPEGDVVIRVAFSSLNYKDALAATGHQGIVKRFPHVPGVDAAGTVVTSNVKEFTVGQEVLVTGYDGGATRWGGWAEFIRVPHEWIVPLPQGLTLREAMILGTAGFTAALCERRLATTRRPAR